jgi:hypothetical protein
MRSVGKGTTCNEDCVPVIRNEDGIVKGPTRNEDYIPGIPTMMMV